ncbi:envelope integrity protein Cei [Pseudonocardia acaciae]|uniref:envelope integrity protein Cei n=1 Tax=Pseudonocardia acaciae TaxID=551276 RepID=UPI0007E8C51C|nr:envelope integrity protein Cei [Pseudonocardia acaciae]
MPPSQRWGWLARYPQPKPYQRRSARPVAVVVSVLTVLVVVTWTVVLSTAGDAPSGAVCPPPSAAPPGQPEIGVAQPPSALDQVAPASPTTVRIRVLNGGGQRGQANLVASQLGDLGFTEAGDPNNDPFYPTGNLACRGNLRYGPNGAPAARTIGLVLPCLALIRDNRADDTVDVAVGTLFGEVHAGKAAKDALSQLSAPSGQPVSVDPQLLAKARAVRC